jgi:hypothetical protein
MDDADFEKAYTEHNCGSMSLEAFSKFLGIAPRTIRRKASKLKLPTWSHSGMVSRPREFTKEYSVPELPPDHRPIEEIKAERIANFHQKENAAKSRQLIDIPIKIKGPVGIWLCGDPHVDDDGCDYPQLMRDKETVVSTEGMFGVNLGDTTNNWVGRLGRLFANQELSHASATLLAKDFIDGVPWLVIILGNHCLWSGNGLNNPINWMANNAGMLAEPWRARLNLKFPNKREVRIHPAHDWKGHSMWNAAHGPSKAAKMMFKDHIMACGHIHEFGYNIHVHPDDVTGGCGLTHAIRLPGYKILDEFGERTGHPSKFAAPYSAVALIDPTAEQERSMITMYFDVQEAAEVLTWKRNKKQ